MRSTLKALIFAAIIAISANAWAIDFSADMVSTGGGRTFSGKMYVAGDKTRTEMAGAVTITRMDKEVAWVIMPGQDMYMEQPLNVQTMVSVSEKAPGEIERNFLGEEVVSGRAAKKYRVVYEAAVGREVVLQWVDNATGIPIKTSSEDGKWSVEFKNFSAGKQPDSLFEVPAGYKKFAMPDMSSMAGAMKKAMQRAGDEY